MYTKSQAFLTKMAHLLDNQTQLDIQAHKVQFTDGDLYLRADITGGAGIVELIDENTTKTIGVTNFDKNKLPKGTYVVLDRIRCGYATTAAADGERNPAALKYSSVYGDLPAALANAELVVTQNDKPLLEVPVQRLFCESRSNKAIGADDGYALEAMRLLVSDAPIGVSLKFPKGVSLPAANHFFEIHLLGARTGQR